jgi:hypothetical protein
MKSKSFSLTLGHSINYINGLEVPLSWRDMTQLSAYSEKCSLQSFLLAIYSYLECSGEK